MNIQTQNFIYRSVLKTRSCMFSIKKIELHGNDIILTKIINLNHRDLYHLYKKRYYIAYKCEITERNFQCFRHSVLIVTFTIAIIIFWERVLSDCDPGIFFRAQDFCLLTEVNNNIHNARSCQFCEIPALRFEDTTALYSPRSEFVQRRFSSLLDRLCVFLKTFDKESKGLQIPLLKPKIEIGSTKSNDNLFAH